MEPEKIHGIALGSPEAKAVLDLVNRASQVFLDDVVKLDKRAAANIVEHRLGLDGQNHSDDDNSIDDLPELDTISWVGKRAFGKLQAYLASQQAAAEQFAADLKEFLVEYYAEYGDDIVSSDGNTLEQAQQAVDARDVFEVVKQSSDPFDHDLVETRVMGHPDVTYPGSDTVFYGAYGRSDGSLQEVYDWN